MNKIVYSTCGDTKCECCFFKDNEEVCEKCYNYLNSKFFDGFEDEDYNTINDNSDELLSITSDIENINAIKNNDGNIIAETLDITRINNMADYLNSYSEQDKPLIAQMLRNGELKYACR